VIGTVLFIEGLEDREVEFSVSGTVEKSEIILTIV
jgi:hypothetical protein